MQFVVRHAAGIAAQTYPLALSDGVTWQQHQQTQKHISEFELPAVPADHIIIPSFSALQHEVYQFQFELLSDTAVTPLQPVPAEGPKPPPNPPNPAVSSHIDCWHSHDNLSGGRVRLTVVSQQPPTDYLFTLSIRPLRIDSISLPECRVQTTQPRALSQMQAAQDIQRRICSPTALAMLLENTCPGSWQETVRACYDPWTKAFGVWPLALHWASRCGVAGAVEGFADWSAPLQLLQQDVALVCSIDFAADRLHGAPLPSSSGHLVVLYGLDHDYAYVMDPAAPDTHSVARKYDLGEFSHAWLSARGAAYVVPVRLCA